MLKVKLEAKPNPDFWQGSHEAKINLKAKYVKVESLKQAAQVCRDFIAKNNLGGGNWTGGAILQDGCQIANVSYNGRIWGKDKQEIIV